MREGKIIAGRLVSRIALAFTEVIKPLVVSLYATHPASRSGEQLNWEANIQTYLLRTNYSAVHLEMIFCSMTVFVIPADTSVSVTPLHKHTAHRSDKRRGSGGCNCGVTPAAKAPSDLLEWIFALTSIVLRVVCFMFSSDKWDATESSLWGESDTLFSFHVLLNKEVSSRVRSGGQITGVSIRRTRLMYSK